MAAVGDVVAGAAAASSRFDAIGLRDGIAVCVLRSKRIIEDMIQQPTPMARSAESGFFRNEERCMFDTAIAHKNKLAYDHDEEEEEEGAAVECEALSDASTCRDLFSSRCRR